MKSRVESDFSPPQNRRVDRKRLTMSLLWTSGPAKAHAAEWRDRAQCFPHPNEPNFCACKNRGLFWCTLTRREAVIASSMGLGGGCNALRRGGRGINDDAYGILPMSEIHQPHRRFRVRKRKRAHLAVGNSRISSSRRIGNIANDKQTQRWTLVIDGRTRLVRICVYFRWFRHKSSAGVFLPRRANEFLADPTRSIGRIRLLKHLWSQWM